MPQPSARRITRSVSVAALFALVGCSGSQSAKTADATPSASAVGSTSPTSDTPDDQQAALERLVREPWGYRRDKWGTLKVPLADWKAWRKVRIWGQPTRVTFRYGDQHFAIDSIWYTKAEGPNDPDACLAKFTAFAMPIVDSYAVRMGPSQLLRVTQQIGEQTRPMIVELVEGSVDTVVANDDYLGAIAVYPSWPGTCLVQGFAVIATSHRDLAVKVRDRWVAEAATQLSWDKKIESAPEPLAR